MDIRWTESHPSVYTVKDVVGRGRLPVDLLRRDIFFAPSFGGLFLERPTFEPANALQTPPHRRARVVLHPLLRHAAGGCPLYAGTRSGASRDGAAIVVLFFLPWLDRSRGQVHPLPRSALQGGR